MALKLTAAQINFLCSPQGQHWLNEARNLPLTTASHLADVQRLRQNLSAEEATAVVEQILLRRRAIDKFSRADDMLFERDALEQATHRLVAHHRAKRFRQFSLIAELGCGIGGDTVRLAAAIAPTGGHILAADLDPARLLFAQHNHRMYNFSQTVTLTQADALKLPARNAETAIFADPARRTAKGKRVFSPAQYAPPLDKLMATYARTPMGIKAGPGLDFAALPAVDEVEVISLAGEVKEATLWLNGLASVGVSRRATLLPGGESLTNAHPDDCDICGLGDFIYEPDGAVIRAGLVKQAATMLGLHLLDEHIAYLGGPALESPSAFVTGYQIEAKLPLRVKVINRHLRQAQIGRINVKQRGTGLSPEKLHKQLKPAATGLERTLILTRLGDDHLALVCKKLSQRNQE